MNERQSGVLIDVGNVREVAIGPERRTVVSVVALFPSVPAGKIGMLFAGSERIDLGARRVERRPLPSLLTAGKHYECFVIHDFDLGPHGNRLPKFIGFTQEFFGSVEAGAT